MTPSVPTCPIAIHTLCFPLTTIVATVQNEPVFHSREAQDLPHLVLVNLARRDEPLLEHGLHVRELLSLHFSDASQFPGRDDCDLELNSRFESWFETPVQSKLSVWGITSL